MEAGVLKGCGSGGLCYRTVNRACGKNVAHASSQLSSQIERSKDSTWFRKMGSGRSKREFRSRQLRVDCIVRQPQQQIALFLGKLLTTRLGRGLECFWFGGLRSV